MDARAQEVLSVIEAVLKDELGIDRALDPSLQLRGELGLDSADAMMLAVELERRFGVDLLAAQGRLETVGDAVALITKLQTAEVRP